VFLLSITARPGDTILRPPNGNTIFGFLGTTGTSLADAFDTMNELAAKIKVTLED
jgi:L-amino acid ligase C-terminal domain 2